MVRGWLDGEEEGEELRREVREVVVRAREAKMEIEGCEGRMSESVRSGEVEEVVVEVDGSAEDMSGD